MLVNFFGIEFDLSIKGIINFIIDNKVAFIPGILYLVFNKLLPMYIIIGIIGIYFMINQLSENDRMKKELVLLKEKNG
jgi:hypothetical protein